MRMRNPLKGAIVGLSAVLVFSSAATAQVPQPQSQPKQGNEARSPWKFYPTDRSVGDGGPAPKRDLTGTWAGPGSGSGIPRPQGAEQPSLTPLGVQGRSQNQPLQKLIEQDTNDPNVIYGDAFGVEQNTIN